MISDSKLKTATMTDTLTKEQFVEMLRPLAEALQAIDVDAADAAAQAEKIAAFGGKTIAAIRAAATA
ncbi:MAG: truncated hemoglobin YjbI, partial [Planctomycetota bacterium]